MFESDEFVNTGTRVANIPVEFGHLFTYYWLICLLLLGYLSFKASPVFCHANQTVINAETGIVTTIMTSENSNFVAL